MKERKKIALKPVRSAVELDTDIHKSSMQNGASNILVAVRSRPWTKKDGGKQIAEILDDKIVMLADPVSKFNRPEKAFRGNRLEEKHYAYDHALGQNASQEDVFDKTTRFLLNGVVNGFNATVFAYGATGAGKTYTMLGTEESPGIMMLTVKDLFSQMQSFDDREFQVKLSYLEIYNEQLRDLINVNSDLMEIREDPVRGNVVAGISELLVTSFHDIIETLRLSNKNRTVEPTMANETSSRSHGVLQIIVEHQEKVKGLKSEIVVGKLNMIDLAGSERASKTQNRGMRLVEGANINRSLLALGNCINALFEQNSKGCNLFIPYRDSKLTRLLKDSLGGNCRTVMIAWISPFESGYEDTSNTLKYANRAKNIKTNVRRNVMNVNNHISNYTEVINQLKGEIQNLQHQLSRKHKSPKKLKALQSAQEFEIEIIQHFQTEAQWRRKILEIEQNIQQIGFVIYNRQLEMVQREENGESTEEANNTLEELNLLKNTVKSYETNLEKYLSKLQSLEEKRNKLKSTWEGSRLTADLLQQFTTAFEQQVISMDNLNLQRKERKSETKIKEKDLYIQWLQEQLSLRDRVINQQRDLFRQNHIDTTGQIEPLVDLSKFQKIQQTTFSHRQQDRSPIASLGRALPPIRSHSRIPKPKYRLQHDNKMAQRLSPELPSASLKKNWTPSSLSTRNLMHLESSRFDADGQEDSPVPSLSGKFQTPLGPRPTISMNQDPSLLKQKYKRNNH